MPAAPISRQAGVSSWFETGAGRALLHLEQPVAVSALRSRPSQPWLWLSAIPAGLPESGVLQGRGLRLFPQGAGFAGDLRCGLPLPIPSESLHAIVVQHAVVGDIDRFLDECARVLAPGGRLWLFALNPLSPYRLRWRRHIASSPQPEAWRRSIQRAGLYCPTPPRYLGPAWNPASVGEGSAGRGPWRAVCLFEAEKRSGSPNGLIPTKVRWQRPVATI
jgi:SAM-dependent methyltransferase